MSYILEVIDKTGRKIHLSNERWSHIRKKHPEIEEIKQALINPNKLKENPLDETINYYHKYFKHKKSQGKYLLISVKYLNGNGFIITAFFEKQIR